MSKFEVTICDNVITFDSYYLNLKQESGTLNFKIPFFSPLLMGKPFKFQDLNWVVTSLGDIQTQVFSLVYSPPSYEQSYTLGAELVEAS